MSFSHGSSTPNTALVVPHTQNTAPVLEFRCLFTADLKRKQKRWQDGKLKFHTHNKRVMVYDEKSNFVGDSHWREDFPLGEGEELNLERGGVMVEVGDCVGKTEQDLTELVDKRIKDKEGRAAAIAAKGTPVRASVASMRNEGTPGLYPQHKPLNAMLTPSGHYGRAVMPTTSPFEDRQRLAGGKAEGKENDRPTKRQKMNDAPSKNGYAQNLMGATLSLSSSRPPSTAPIRYEPMKLKSIIRPEPVDLTLDENEDSSTPKPQGNDQRRRQLQGERDSKNQKRQRKSPPPKSTYAGNLTGTSLNLSMPLMRRDVGLPKPRPVKPSIPIELDNSSSDENLEEDSRPEAKVQSPPRITSKKLQPPKPVSAPMDSSDENTEPPTKVARKGNIVARVTTSRKKTFPFAISSESDSDNDHQVVSKEVSTSSKITRGKKPLQRDSNPVVNSEEDVQPKKKARTTKQTKDSRPSKQDSLPPSRLSSPDIPVPKNHVSKPAARSSSVAEIQPDVNGSSLRIKSKPPRRMMMHVDRSNTRTPSTSAARGQAARKPSAHLQAKDDEIVMSQDTRQLNAFCQKQEAKLQARLAGKKQTIQEPHVSSPASTDKGINHQTIDMLLSRKSVQILRNDISKPAVRKDSVSKDKAISAPVSATANFDTHSSSPAFEVVPRERVMQSNPTHHTTKVVPPINALSATISTTNDSNIDSSSPEIEVHKAIPKQVANQAELSPPNPVKKVSQTKSTSVTIPATANSDLSSSSPAFEIAISKTKPVSARRAISATKDSYMDSSPISPNESRFGDPIKENDIQRENASNVEPSSKAVAIIIPNKIHAPARPITQEFPLQQNGENQQKSTEVSVVAQKHHSLPSVGKHVKVTEHVGKLVAEKPKSPEVVTDKSHGDLGSSRGASKTEELLTLNRAAKFLSREAEPEVLPSKKVSTSQINESEPKVASRSKSPQSRNPNPNPKAVDMLPQTNALGNARELEVDPVQPQGKSNLDEAVKVTFPSKTNSVSVERFGREVGIQNARAIPPIPAPRKLTSSPRNTRSPSVIPSSVSPEPTDFVPPDLSNKIQFASAHFQSVMKSPVKANIATKPPMPEITPEAELSEPQAIAGVGKHPLDPKKKIVKPSPESSPVLPKEPQHRPGQGTLEQAELTPVIRMTDIPTAPSSLIPPPPISKAKVVNPATTKGKGRSLSELAASTVNTNEIQTPLSTGAVSTTSSAAGLGFNVMPPPPPAALQISRTTAAAGIGNTIAKRRYPTPPPPRVSRNVEVQSEPSGGGWEGKVLVLGGTAAGSGEQKKENGVGVKDGPWCREAFDLFGEWVRPVG